MHPPRPSVGVGVILVRDERVLLYRRRAAHGDGTWGFPGGHLEYGESIEACAERETREETGLAVLQPRLVAVTNDVMAAEGKHYITLYVLGEASPGDPRVLEPEKCQGWVWYAWDALPTPLFLPIQNLIAQGFHLAAHLHRDAQQV